MARQFGFVFAFTCDSFEFNRLCQQWFKYYPNAFLPLPQHQLLQEVDSWIARTLVNLIPVAWQTYPQLTQLLEMGTWLHRDLRKRLSIDNEWWWAPQSWKKLALRKVWSLLPHFSHPPQLLKVRGNPYMRPCAPLGWGWLGTRKRIIIYFTHTPLTPTHYLFLVTV